MVLLYAVLGIWISAKKLVAGSVALLILSGAAGAFVFRKEIATMAAIKEYVPGMYICNVTNDYKLDDMLESDIRDADDMISACCHKLLAGFPFDVDIPMFGCSSFSCAAISLLDSRIRCFAITVLHFSQVICMTSDISPIVGKLLRFSGLV